MTEDLLLFVVGEEKFEASATWDRMPLEYTPASPPMGPVSTETNIVTRADFGGELQTVTLKAAPSDRKTLGLSDTALDPAEKAREVLGELDSAMERINDYRIHYGAMHNRLEDITNAISERQAITTGARSRIVDADYTIEAGRMIRAQLTREAGLAAPAQSNQTLDGVLALLRQIWTANNRQKTSRCFWCPFILC